MSLFIYLRVPNDTEEDEWEYLCGTWRYRINEDDDWELQLIYIPKEVNLTDVAITFTDDS